MSVCGCGARDGVDGGDDGGCDSSSALLSQPMWLMKADSNNTAVV